MTFDEIWDSGNHISQSIFKEEGQALYEAVIQLPPNSTIVEIGAYVGRSTHVLASTAQLNNSRVITIDPFLPAFDGWHNSDPKTVFIDNVLKVFSNVSLIEGYSQDVHKVVPDCDFLFIDGDHSYEGVANDCKFYLPKLKKGNTVAFHDYNGTCFYGLIKAVNKYCGGWEVVNNAFSLTTRRKPC